MRWFRRKPAPREGWVVLLDAAGREVSERIPVVVNGDPRTFQVDRELTFHHIKGPIVHTVRVIDADGVTWDAPTARSGERRRRSVRDRSSHPRPGGCGAE